MPPARGNGASEAVGRDFYGLQTNEAPRMVYHLRGSMATTRTRRASIYALLQVHPAAPLELITAVYWRLVGRAGVSSRGDAVAGSRVRRLERAYQVLSDPEKRAAYDSAMNIPANPPIPSLGGDGSVSRRM